MAAKNKKPDSGEIEIVEGVTKRLFSYLAPYKVRLVWAVVFGMLAGTINGLLIFLLKSVFTVVLPQDPEQEVPTHFRPFDDVPLSFLQNIQIPRPEVSEEKEWLFVTAICLTVPLILLFRGVFTYLHNYIMLWLSNKLVFRLRDQSFRAIMSQPLSFFHNVRQGELMHSVASQAVTSAGAAMQLLSAWIQHPISIISILLACLMLDWLYTLGAFVVFPLCILPVAAIARKVRKAGGRQEIESEGLMVTMQESFDGIKLVKAHAREEYQVERFNKSSRSLLKWLMQWQKRMEISTPLVEAVASLGISFGLVYAWVTGMDAAKFLVLNMAMVSIYPHAKALSRLHLQLQRFKMAASRVFGYIDREPEIQNKPDAVKLEGFQGPLELDNVSFAYEPGTPVLKDLSLTFEPGKKYALVGQTGSGKSTILSLLMRFYDPDSGCCKING
ncbi:MAG: ABC transporter ATP-binding protein, partial [Verrucomicrobiales bacterium]|nr:ABC transporter ATP-binding protein [Verrucomicrobiales bacterium]